MSLVRLPKLIRKINTSYIVIIVINKARYLKLFRRIISKYLPYDSSTCRGLSRASSESIPEVIYSINSMNST